MVVKRHPELLVNFGVEVGDSGFLDRIAAGVAKKTSRSFDESGRIKPARRRRVALVRADARRVWPIIATVGSRRVINAAYVKPNRARHSAA